jgi:Zn ribbon nucleic-acid-binding protein
VCTACSDTACDIALELPVGVRLRSAAQKLSAIDEAHFVTSAVCPNCGVQTEDVQWSYTGSDGYTQILCSHRNYGLDTIFTYQDFYTATCHNCDAMQNWESVRAGLTEADYIFTVTHTRNVTMCQGRSHI